MARGKESLQALSPSKCMSRRAEKHCHVDNYYSLMRHGTVWWQSPQNIQTACLRNIEFQNPLCETPGGMLIIPGNETLAPKPWSLNVMLYLVRQSLSVTTILTTVLYLRNLSLPLSIQYNLRGLLQNGILKLISKIIHFLNIEITQ